MVKPIKKTVVGFDAMGGDFSCSVTIKAAFLAASSAHVVVHIFGDQEIIEAELSTITSSWKTLPIKIIHCSEVIDMVHSATRSVLLYKDSSLVCMVKSLAEGTVDVVVSAGNSGALVAAGVLFVGLFEGVLKPALTSCFPTIDQEDVLVLDLGGTVDCKPEHLAQFALMGSLYMRVVGSLSCPRVALLSNGHEEGKGSLAVKSAYRLLSKVTDPGYQFIGNIESRDIFDGKADVIVVDGFAGNVMLKMAQGMIKTLKLALKKETEQSLFNKASLICARPVLEKIFSHFDYTKKGGALVLGLKKPIFVAHGSSTTTALFNAIIAAEQFVRMGYFKKIVDLMSEEFAFANTNNSDSECQVLDI